MKSGLILVLFLAGFLALVSCGGAVISLGGAEAGNPTERIVKGLIDDAGAVASVRYQSSGSCFADAVIATDSAARTTTANAASDCSFQLSLPVGRSYSLGFVLGDSFVASMSFNNGSGTIASNTMIVEQGDSDIDLGRVTLSAGVAIPENEPARQNDSDSDGISDFDDDDDDDDGIGDDDEEDCDLDGFFDDNDEDNDTCEDSDDSNEDDPVAILETNPGVEEAEKRLDEFEET